MGVRESVGELEAAMAELNEEKTGLHKKAREAAAHEDSLGRMGDRIGNIESGITELRKSVAALQKKMSLLEIAKEKSGAVGKDYSADIAELRKSVSEMRSSIASIGRSGEPAEAPAKDLLDLKSRIDVLQKYVEGRMSAPQASQKGDAAAEGMINSRLDEVSRKIDEISKFEEKINSVRNDTAKMISDALKNIPKYDSGKLKSVADTERNLEEKLKLFALNSDVEKIWKDVEGLRRYIDEKSKYADGLANSLQAWESRRLELAAKERDFEEKITAFPELKLLDSRIRKAERAILELQRHFVAAKIAEPIIME